MGEGELMGVVVSFTVATATAETVGVAAEVPPLISIFSMILDFLGTKKRLNPPLNPTRRKLLSAKRVSRLLLEVPLSVWPQSLILTPTSIKAKEFTIPLLLSPTLDFSSSLFVLFTVAYSLPPILKHPNLSLPLR